MSIGSFLTKSFYKVADPVLTAIAHPFQVGGAIISKDKTVKEVTNQFFSQPKSSQITQTVISGINAELALLGGSSIVAKGLGASIKGITGKGVAKVVGLGIAERVVGQSTKVQKELVQLPTSASNFGQNIGQFIDNPSLSTASDIAKENPVLTTALAGAGLLITGKAVGSVANVYSNYANTQAVQENTKATLGKDNLPSDTIQEVHTPITTLPYTPPLDQDVGSPLEPTTEVLPSSSSEKVRKRRRTTKKMPSQNINQKVYVYNDNKKDIKRRGNLICHG